MGDHNMLTLDTPYGFLVSFFNGELGKAPGPRVHSRGFGRWWSERTRLIRVLEGEPERLCFVTPVVAIVCLSQPNACVEYWNGCLGPAGETKTARESQTVCVIKTAERERERQKDYKIEKGQ